MWSAVKGDAFFYRKVVTDRTLTVEAAAMTLISSLVMGLGLMLVGVIKPLAWVIGAVGWSIMVLVIGAGMIAPLGRVVGGTGSYSQVARGVGYAVVPQALAFVPVGGFLPGFIVGGVWAAFCSVVAVREAHHIPNRSAAILVLVPILLGVGVVPLLLLFSGSS